MNQSREQTLINSCFAFAIMAKVYMKTRSDEEVAEWVRHNLAEIGFHTRPVGSSWGVLYTPDKPNEGEFEIYMPNRI